jgi:hypothetical protein
MFEERDRSEIIAALFKSHLDQRRLLSYLLSLQTEHPHRTPNSPIFDIKVLACVAELAKVENGRPAEDMTIGSIIRECHRRNIFQYGDVQEHERIVLSTLATGSMLSCGWNVDSAADGHHNAFDLLKQSRIEVVETPIKTLFADFGYLPAKCTWTLDNSFAVGTIDCKELNVAIITGFGGLNIEWVSDFTRHLFLDIPSGRLCVFWHAAICKAIADGSAGFFL